MPIQDDERGDIEELHWNSRRDSGVETTMSARSQLRRIQGPLLLAFGQTALAYVLLQHSYALERLHYVGRTEFDPSYESWARVLVVWLNVPAFVLTFWTSYIWSSEAFDYSKLPGIFAFWFWMGSTIKLWPRCSRQRWIYLAGAACLFGVAVWYIYDFIADPVNEISRPPVLSGRGVEYFAFPIWFLAFSGYFVTAWRSASLQPKGISQA